MNMKKRHKNHYHGNPRRGAPLTLLYVFLGDEIRIYVVGQLTKKNAKNESIGAIYIRILSFILHVHVFAHSLLNTF